MALFLCLWIQYVSYSLTTMVHLFYYDLLVFRYNTKDYCIQQAKPQLDANRPKSPLPPPLLPFGEILSLHCVTWCNFAEPYFMYHWTSHWGPGRRAPLQPNRKILRLDLSISCNFQQLWLSWQQSPPPCLFIKNLACITHVEYTWSPYYKSELRFLLSNIFFRLPTLLTLRPLRTSILVPPAAYISCWGVAGAATHLSAITQSCLPCCVASRESCPTFIPFRHDKNIEWYGYCSFVF